MVTCCAKTYMAVQVAACCGQKTGWGFKDLLLLNVKPYLGDLRMIGRHDKHFLGIIEKRQPAIIVCFPYLSM